MIISEQTINELKDKGIFVRWYPEDTYEEFKKRIWQGLYECSYNYCKNHVAGSDAVKNGTANKLYDTIEELEEKSKHFADSTCDRHCSAYNFDTLYITHDKEQILVKKEGVKSKEITTDYVLKLVERNRKVYDGYYGKFAMAMQRICKEKGYTDRFCVYPTTYGIGVWLFYNMHADENIADIRSIMDERGIEYYNEYSDRLWVYRFKVSKKRENINKIF